ncbi:MAG: hypothetical protein NTY38_07475, partial [Acidobacteria bacterium]|nr:hypothetical protein [Acidobacteriota bacterium]
TTPPRPGLLVGLPLSSVRDVQNRLRKMRIRPQRLEVGSVALLGALMRHLRQIAYPHAVVACELGVSQTRIYLLGKDGVHTPAALPHGLRSIEETAMKELSAPDIATAKGRRDRAIIAVLLGRGLRRWGGLGMPPGHQSDAGRIRYARREKEDPW